MPPTDHPRPLRAVIYNRASADKTGQRVSVESQDTENRAWCAREGWDIAATVNDNDRSATRYATRDREGYRRIRDSLQSGQWGQVDVLVMWESSRGERTMDGHIEMRALCQRLGVKLAYRGRVLDMADGDDRFTAGLDALLDEREAERTRERIKRSHRASVQAGKPRGTIPYGYRREYAPGTNHMINQEPDPETAPIVQGVFADILSGQPLYRIAQRLNEAKAPTPSQARDGRRGRTVERHGWTASMIRNMVQKPTYAGLRTHHGVVTGEGTWRPIISVADYHAAQAILKDPARNQYESREPKWLLSGVAKCGVCGGWMRPMLNRGRMTYVCAGITPTSSKGHVARDQPKLDIWVTARVVGRLLRPDVLDVFRPPAPRGGVPWSEVEQELADLRARLTEYELSAGSPGGVSAAAFARIEARLSGRISELEEALVPPAEVPEEVAAAAGPDAEAAWERFSVSSRRRIVRALCEVSVGPVRERGRRGFEGESISLVWRG